MWQRGFLHLGAALSFVLICAKTVSLADISLAQTTSSKIDDKSEKMRERLEQLFIWRVADRLQLTPQQEQTFSNEYKNLSSERLKNSQELDSLLDEMEKSKDKKQVSKFLNAYESGLRKSSQLQLREVQVMKKLLGSEKIVDYMLLKREMTKRFKDVLRNSPVAKANESKAGSPKVLKEPEVIEEH